MAAQAGHTAAGASKANTEQPITQETRNTRANWPIWMKQLPYWEIKKDDNFTLIPPEQLAEITAGEEPEAIRRIQDDIKFLEEELLRLFKERDYEAKVMQNQYRLYQICYMVLAALATLFGSLLAISIDSAKGLVPWLAFAETIVALFTTYLATISGREAPLQKWLINRHKAEILRREYFRYILNLEPYEGLNSLERRRLLSRRAAEINLHGTIDPKATGS